MSLFHRYASQPKAEIVWWNPISWIRRCWHELTTASPCDGHTFFTALWFCTLLLGVWLSYILFIGWFRYLFAPRMWIGRVDEIKEGYIDEWGNYVKQAKECIRANADTPDAIVKIVERDHFIFMSDDGFAKISSPKYNWKRGWKEAFRRTD